MEIRQEDRQNRQNYFYVIFCTRSTICDFTQKTILKYKMSYHEIWFFELKFSCEGLVGQIEYKND